MAHGGPITSAPRYFYTTLSLRDFAPERFLKSPMFSAVAASRIGTGAIGVRAGIGIEIHIVDAVDVEGLPYDRRDGIHGRGVATLADDILLLDMLLMFSSEQ